MGTEKRQEFQCRLVFPGRQGNPLVYHRPVSVCRQYLQHHPHRADGRCLRDGNRRLSPSSIYQIQDLHDPGIFGKAFRQPLTVLFLRHQHHRQHLPRCGRRPLFRRAHPEASLPGSGALGVRADLRGHRGLLYHPGRPFRRHQYGPHPGGGAPGRVHRHDGHLLCQRRR